MTHKTPDVDWINNSVPVSRKFNDPYYSIDDGIAEANYVFLEGNNLPERFRNGFQIGELGFELDQRMVRAGDVAGAAGAGADARGGLHHGADHLRVLAHAEIVVGAPDGDLALAVRRQGRCGVLDPADEVTS